VDVDYGVGIKLRLTMPAKSDPEYFKIVNMGSSGLRNYWEVPNNSPTGKFDYIHEAATVNKMFVNRSNDPAATELEDGDIEEETENEPDTSSENSLDMDVDMLILNVREKLKMGNKFCSQSANFWQEATQEDLGLKLAGKSNTGENCENSASIPVPVPSSCDEDSNLRWRHASNSCPSHRRKQGASHSQQQPSLSQFNKQIINGGIHKSHRSNSCSSLWTSKLNRLSKKKLQQGYNLLQELLDSGSLINEAVRRINGNKIFTPISSNGSGKGTLSQNCTFLVDDSELNFPNIQIGSPLTRNIMC